MSAGESRQSFSAEEVKAEVRQTIRQLSELTRSEATFDEFCETVLTKVVKLTGAHGALLWQSTNSSPPRITHKAGRPTFSLDVDEVKHTALVNEVIEKQGALGILSESVRGSDEHHDPNATSCLLLFSPVFNRMKVCCGSLELLQRNDINENAQEGYLKFLSRIAELFPRWHEHHDLNRLTQSADQLSTTLDFVTVVHGSIDFSETAFAIANESRRLLNCDRVSFAKWNGSRCKVIAVSSQDRFDNRANVIRLLGRVATSSVSINTPLWITGSTDGLAPEIARRINEYMDESHCRTLAVIPLVKEPEVNVEAQFRPGLREKPKKLGAVIIEYFDTDVKQDQVADQCKLLIEHAQIAANNAQLHSDIFLMPLWKRMGDLQKLLFRDHIAKTITGLVALALFVLLLIFYPAKLKMKVDGVMRPEERCNVFARTEGFVTAVNFDHGDDVKVGDVLVELTNPDLDLRITETDGQMQVIDEKIKEVKTSLSRQVELNVEDSVTIGGQLDLYKSQQENLAERLELMKIKKSAQKIISPIDGKIVTWDLKRRLKDMTISANQQVVSIANFSGDWQTELRIPQNKIGYVAKAFMANDNEPLEVEFRVATNPNIKLKGKLVQVAARADAGQSGIPEFRAIVDADTSELKDLRPGAGVTAKIYCGRERLGFVWFYQIIDFLRTRVFF